MYTLTRAHTHIHTKKQHTHTHFHAHIFVLTHERKRYKKQEREKGGGEDKGWGGHSTHNWGRGRGDLTTQKLDKFFGCSILTRQDGKFLREFEKLFLWRIFKKHFRKIFWTSSSNTLQSSVEQIRIPFWETLLLSFFYAYLALTVCLWFPVVLSWRS